MYNSHRGMVPPAPSSRLAELMDQLRAEFESQAGRAGEYEHQSTYDPYRLVVVDILQTSLQQRRGKVADRISSHNADSRDRYGSTEGLSARTESVGTQAKVICSPIPFSS